MGTQTQPLVEKLVVKDVIYDPKLHFRTSLDQIHIRNMVDALRMDRGHVLPPITVDRATKKIVDGVHRWHAVKEYVGEGATILCELRDYADDNELFLAVAASNRDHGLGYTEFEKTKIFIEADKRGITFDILSQAMKIPVDRLTKAITTKTAWYKTGDEPKQQVPLKAFMRPLAGQYLTDAQKSANESGGGMKATYFIEQLCKLVEADFIDWASAKEVAGLRRLQGLLDEKLPKD